MNELREAVAFKASIGTIVTIVSVLPDVADEIVSTRSWIMAMRNDCRFGWCYAIDGLKSLA